MPANTPVWSLPYPLGTDPVSDGDDAIKNLATKVDNLIKAGRVVGVTTNAQGEGVVTFPVPFPNSLIAVVITDAKALVGAIPYKWLLDYSDKTKFSWVAHNSNGTVLPSFSVTFGWIAIGT